MKKRRFFVSGVCMVLLLFSLSACSKKEYTFSQKMGEVVDLPSISDACAALSIPEEELTERDSLKGAVNYTLSSCPELLPDGIQADTVELYITVDQEKVLGVQLFSMEKSEDYDPAKVYQTCKSECERLAALYPDNAFVDCGYSSISENGKNRQPFLETYPDEASFLAAYDEMQQSGYSISGMDIWWVNKENEITFTFRMELTQGGIFYTWTTVDEPARTNYILRK